MNAQVPTPVEGWALVEMFGHIKIAGYCTTVMIGTSALLRCDVPAVHGVPAFTRYYGIGAVFSLTLVTEAIARAAVQQLMPSPLPVYIAPILLVPSAEYRAQDTLDNCLTSNEPPTTNTQET